MAPTDSLSLVAGWIVEPNLSPSLCICVNLYIHRIWSEKKVKSVMIIIEGYRYLLYPKGKRRHLVPKEEFDFHQQTLPRVFANNKPERYDDADSLRGYFEWWFLGIGLLYKTQTIYTTHSHPLDRRSQFELYILKYGLTSAPIALIFLIYENPDHVQLLTLGYG